MKRFGFPVKMFGLAALFLSIAVLQFNYAIVALSENKTAPETREKVKQNSTAYWLTPDYRNGTFLFNVVGTVCQFTNEKYPDVPRFLKEQPQQVTRF